MRYTSTIMGYEHHVAIPHHRDLKVGLLMDVLGEVAEYLGRDRDELLEELFG